MTQAFFTGATGLRSFQRQLDVVANNLANLNTTGFKSDRVLFSDLVYRDYRNGAGPSGDNFGGVNPAQIGTGVQVAQISRNFSQGALQETGEALDFAIRGDGFFIVDNEADQPLYTRAGSFTLDVNNNLVDPATGFMVRRTGVIGESLGDSFGFQQAGDSRINIPFGSAIPGTATSFVEFNGNLPASAVPPQAEILATTVPFQTDFGAATLASSFSELTSNFSDYVDGDTIEVLGTDIDGLPFNFDLPAATSTLGDLIDSINESIDGAVAELNENGSLTITADQPREGFLSLVLRDATDNVNLSDFESHAMAVLVDGSAGDIFESATQVFDQQGTAQNIVFSFRKSSPDTWQVNANLSDARGGVIGSQTYDLAFNDNGTFSFANADTGELSLGLQFNGIDAPQNVDLLFERLSHTASEFGLAQNQDGAPPGVLANISVNGAGLITGVGSNGSEIEIAQLALATFSNVDGLESSGDNYYRATTASGTPSIGSGQTANRGTIVGAQLESANVDITQEFAQLIVAQRAFSANARTITVAEEIMEELTTLIR